MKALNSQCSNPRRTRLPLITATLAVLAAAHVLGADQLPTFQPGFWSFSITVRARGSAKPQTQSVRKCTNPTDDIRKKWQMLAAQTCKFSPIAHNGNRYTYNSTCQKDGMVLSTNSIITVESEQAYRVDTELRTNNQTRKESLVAKREGECPMRKPGEPPRVPQPRTDSGDNRVPASDHP